ncbi:hypothetical protein SAMN05216337_103488 [Bradyrhizobium brasilense]|uniref:Uncharacterized protein n=1 Tax=Bradyrhizobium brasilense TaxID=1419277 RepID=A0A1G7FNJ0_9BRAD|nr:hypothetical protein SAMN05216337_103488 [Bradyrhizobium brasilense]
MCAAVGSLCCLEFSACRTRCSPGQQCARCTQVTDTPRSNKHCLGWRWLRIASPQPVRRHLLIHFAADTALYCAGDRGGAEGRRAGAPFGPHYYWQPVTPRARPDRQRAGQPPVDGALVPRRDQDPRRPSHRAPHRSSPPQLSSSRGGPTTRTRLGYSGRRPRTSTAVPSRSVRATVITSVSSCRRGRGRHGRPQVLRPRADGPGGDT